MNKLLKIFAVAGALVCAQAANAVVIDGINYKFLDTPGEVAVIAHESGTTMYYKDDIVIPQTVSYEGSDYTVTRIDDGAFRGTWSVKSVVLPATLTSIGEEAFREMHSIHYLDIPEGVTEIGKYAFADSPFRSVKFPDGITSLEEGLFMNDTQLVSVTLPSKLQAISNHLFENCQELTSINIPEGVVTIGYKAFRRCIKLRDITIPSSVESIDALAFSGCEKLACSIDFSRATALTTVGEEAFVGTNMAVVDLSATKITELGKKQFYIDKLAAIVLPPTLEDFKISNFVEMYLKYVKFTGDVKSAYISNFNNNKLIIEMGGEVPPVCPDYLTWDTGNLVIVPNAKAKAAYSEAVWWKRQKIVTAAEAFAEVDVATPGDLEFVLLTENRKRPEDIVTLKVNGSLNAADFQVMKTKMPYLMNLDLTGCDNLDIPAQALDNSANLFSIKLPPTLQSIGTGALQNCTLLHGELTIPATVKEIGGYAFALTNYRRLSFAPGSNLSVIGDNAFTLCSTLGGTINFPPTLTSIGNCAFEGTCINGVDFSACTSLTTIGSSAFYNLGDLKGPLCLPPSLQSIGAAAFAMTSFDSDLVFYPGLKYIGDAAFSKAHLKGAVVLPETLTYIGAHAFEYNDFTYVTWPSTVTEIKDNMFTSCSYLLYADIPDNITSIGEWAFAGCSKITDFHLPASLKELKTYALSSTSVRRLILPDGVEKIGSSALPYSNLVSLALPFSLQTSITYSLGYMNSLRNITSNSLKPVESGLDVTRGSMQPDSCLFAAPTEAYREYITNDCWGKFSALRNEIPVTVKGNGSLTFQSVPAQDGCDLPLRGGMTLFVPEEKSVTLTIVPNEGERILSAYFGGIDITSQIGPDGLFIATPTDYKCPLSITFSSTTGIDDIEIADAPASPENLGPATLENIDPATTPVYNLQGIRVSNPSRPGIYIINRRKVALR